MKHLLCVGVAALALVACTPPSKTEAPVASSAAASPNGSPIAELPAGEYRMDKLHSSLTFKLSHVGFSNYTAFFSVLDATMTLDPAHPETATLSATVDPRSLVLNAPPKGFHDELMGKSWLDASAFPQITFKSTQVEKTGDYSAKVTGDLTLHGVTKPVVMDVVFNGGYEGMAGLDPNARIGFSAKGSFNRSDFGLVYGIPAPGTTMGVGDKVDFAIETEFSGPELKAK